MKTKHCLTFAGLGLALLLSPVSAQTEKDASPPTADSQKKVRVVGSEIEIDPALRARFGFVGPAILETGWSCNNLRLSKPDKDGRRRIFLNNSRRARIDIVDWKNGKLVKTTRTTGGQIAGFEVADFNGDGIDDFVYFDYAGKLHVHLEGKTPKELRPIEVGRSDLTDALALGDLDGDKLPDLIVRTREGFRIVTRLAAGAKVSAPMEIQASKLRAFDLWDLDADGRLDLVVHAQGGLPLQIKLGRAGGGFGPWIGFAPERMRSVGRGTSSNGKPSLVTVEGAQRRAVEYAFAASSEQGLAGLEVHALPGRAEGDPFQRGDFDGDGDEDLVLAASKGAELLYLLAEKDGYRMKRIPSLSGINSMATADLDGDGKLDLLLASPEEKALAWKSGAKPLSSFPDRISAPEIDEPQSVAYLDGILYLLSRDDRRKGTVRRYKKDDAGAWKLLPGKVTLGRISKGPARLLVAELDPVPGPELCWMQSGDGLQVLFSAAKDGWFATDKKKADPGFTKDLEDGSLSLIEIEGKPWLQVVGKNFIRQFRFDGAAQPVVHAQDNGPVGMSGLSLAGRTASGKRVYVDQKARMLRYVEEGRSDRSVDLPSIGIAQLLVQGETLLLLGRDGLLRLPPEKRSARLQQLRTVQPPSDKTRWFDTIVGDFDKDGVRELALLDGKIHGFHLFVPRGKELLPALVFPVFELKDEDDSDYEPHAWQVGDVDGDGREDLILLCYDRLLLYLQED
jgi:FG-GAP-like repeat